MISFKSRDSKKTLILGGQSALDATGSDPEVGVVGPFPRYSINREDISTEDGTHINSKFSITVTGTATIKTTDDQDMLTKGERQTRVQGEALILAQLNRNQWPMQGTGKLEIAAYGGGAKNTITFNDARILSIDLPEQNEISNGIQNQEYTIQFEAYDDNSVVDDGTSGSTVDSTGVKEQDFKISALTESWDLQPTEQFSYRENDPSTYPIPYRTYTLTHSLTATGIKQIDTDYGADNLLANDGEAWRQAVKFITKRLSYTGTSGKIITEEGLDRNIVNIQAPDGRQSNWFNPAAMDSSAGGIPGTAATTGTNPTPHKTLGFDFYQKDSEDERYKAFDHVRTVQTDLHAGSYSVTDTWVLAIQKESTAIIDLDISVDANPEADEEFLLPGETATPPDPNDTTIEQKGALVSIQGTVVGHNTKAGTDNQHDKYANALTAFEKLEGKLKLIADQAYREAFGFTAPEVVDPVTGEITPADSTRPTKLRDIQFSKNVGINKVTGTITFSASYDDRRPLLARALEETLQVDDSGETPVIAIIGVILKSTGPVYQNIGTKTEGRRSVSYTAKVKRGERNFTPACRKKEAEEGIVDKYKPDANNGFNIHCGPFVQNRSESYNPATGDYSITKEWVFSTKVDPLPGLVPCPSATPPTTP